MYPNRHSSISIDCIDLPPVVQCTVSIRYGSIAVSGLPTGAAWDLKLLLPRAAARANLLRQGGGASSAAFCKSFYCSMLRCRRPRGRRDLYAGGQKCIVVRAIVGKLFLMVLVEIALSVCESMVVVPAGPSRTDMHDVRANGPTGRGVCEVFLR